MPGDGGHLQGQVEQQTSSNINKQVQTNQSNNRQITISHNNNQQITQICEDRSLSYRQLMDWAGGVRARLAEAAGPAGKETQYSDSDNDNEKVTNDSTILSLLIPAVTVTVVAIADLRAKETRVGIMMPRSCEMAVAYVAAMLGGYTVVPLDPQWPEALCSL